MTSTTPPLRPSLNYYNSVDPRDLSLSLPPFVSPRIYRSPLPFLSSYPSEPSPHNMSSDSGVQFIARRRKVSIASFPSQLRGL
ncbi:uncharacterized protein BDV17DRAFT_257811, partial [Aspergillus undulatus]|uniref:uncharacterized protein n=1 Tax=Aspergillus undulatus TaxID=1810928 RepID=UPI003CCD4FE3